MRVSKRKMKNDLKNLYPPCESQKKEKFLRQFGIPHISTGEFMWQQLWYIKKITWLVSLGIFAAAVWLGRTLDKETIWILSAMAPYLALFILTESGKSRGCRMEELEYATRFSLKSLLLARMGAVAGFHGMIFLLLTACMGTYFHSVMEDIFYILVPYFLTVCLGGWLLRTYRGKESTYVCLGVPVFVSIFAGITGQTFPIIYGADMLIVFFTIKEWILFFRQTEEPVWN